MLKYFFEYIKDMIESVSKLKKMGFNQEQIVKMMGQSTFNDMTGILVSICLRR